jgi:hypothetical protein
MALLQSFQQLQVQAAVTVAVTVIALVLVDLVVAALDTQ